MLTTQKICFSAHVFSPYLRCICTWISSMTLLMDGSLHQLDVFIIAAVQIVDDANDLRFK